MNLHSIKWWDEDVRWVYTRKIAKWSQPEQMKLETRPQRTFGNVWTKMDKMDSHTQIHDLILSVMNLRNWSPCWITIYRLDIKGHQVAKKPSTKQEFPHKSGWKFVMFLTGVFYLLIGVAVAAHGPQVLDRPPQQDDEEAAEERDHGWGEEGPPHALAIAVAWHVGKVRDDQVHLLRVPHHGVLGGLELNVTICSWKHAGPECSSAMQTCSTWEVLAGKNPLRKWMEIKSQPCLSVLKLHHPINEVHD